jgi:hypothetical protein
MLKNIPAWYTAVLISHLYVSGKYAHIPPAFTFVTSHVARLQSIYLPQNKEHELF